MRWLWVTAALAGCGFDVDSTDLDGTWTNGDDGVARQFAFDAATGAYEIATDGATVQSGTYTVADDTLVTLDGEEVTRDNVIVWTVGWDASGSPAGTTFGNVILRFAGDEMDVSSTSAASGERTWVLVE